MRSIGAFLVVILSLLSYSGNAQYGFDTVRVYFDIGETYLKQPARATLDSVAMLIISENRPVLIFAYADYLGTEKPNDKLAEARAETVKTFLLATGMNPSRIIQSSGVGQVTIRGKEHIGNQEYRKVEIFIKRSRSSGIELPPKAAHQAARLKDLAVNQTLVLEHINFYESRSTVRPESAPYLKELLQIMKDYPRLKVRLEGHICCLDNVGDAYDQDKNNFTLSLNRAKVIHDYLVNNGIDKSRLSFKGFGKKNPLVHPEITEEDAYKNRRVEVRIMAK